MHLAVDAIPGADLGSVTLTEGDGKPRSAAVTDSFLVEVDAKQYEDGEGPCLDSARTGRPHDIDDMRTEDRWPRFAARSVAQGLLSLLSLPLHVRSESIGAFNLYSRSANAFGDRDMQVAQLFASNAALGIANSAAHDELRTLVEQLREALQTRDLIGEAKGILMATEGCTDQQAFQMLVTASQHSNRKLRDIAAELVKRHEQGLGDTQT